MKEQQKPTLEQELSQYVKNENGAIFHVVGKPDLPGVVFLRSGNKYLRTTYTSVKQKIVDGKWSGINEHELREWKAKDDAYMQSLTHKLVQRTILAQMLLEVNDELIDDYADDKYLKNQLEKSNKACERIAIKEYQKLYDTDKSILVNLMKQLEEFSQGCAKIPVNEWPFLNKMLKEYKSDPEKWQPETVEFVGIED